MIDVMAQRITSYLVEKGAVTSDDADVQIYGLQVILSTFINFLGAILLSLLLGQTVFGLSFLLTFMLLRRFTGGYHANSYLGCFVLMLLVLLVGCVLRPLYNGNLSMWIADGTAILSLLLIFLLAPIDHVNKPSTPDSRRRFRFLSRILALVLAVFVVLGLPHRQLESPALGVLMTLLTTGIMLVVAKIQKKGVAIS